MISFKSLGFTNKSIYIFLTNIKYAKIIMNLKVSLYVNGDQKFFKFQLNMELKFKTDRKQQTLTKNNKKFDDMTFI